MLRILAVLALSGVMSAHAGITWEAVSQDFKKSPADKELLVSYPFKNAGDGPVTIRSISSSCGCTTAELPKKTYLAGESGTLVAKFVFGGRTGAQSKTITVLTVDGKKEVLTLNCVISDDPVTLSPSFVYWRVGEAAEGKRVKVMLSNEPPVKIVAVASSNPRITADLAAAAEGGQQVIDIRPADTAKAESAEIFVQTDYPPEGPMAYSIQVRIK